MGKDLWLGDSGKKGKARIPPPVKGTKGGSSIKRKVIF